MNGRYAYRKNTKTTKTFAETTKNDRDDNSYSAIIELREEIKLPNAVNFYENQPGRETTRANTSLLVFALKIRVTFARSFDESEKTKLGQFRACCPRYGRRARDAEQQYEWKSVRVLRQNDQADKRRVRSRKYRRTRLVISSAFGFTSRRLGRDGRVAV